MPLIFHPGDPDPDLFPAHYQAARERWLERLPRSALPCEPVPFPVPGHTPQGGLLSTDCAWFGAPEAERVLVLIAGTHGIEGFAGSAILCQQLDRLPATLPPELAILCIHALNPWGYAWHRRCDAEGVDLNRNFIDFSQPLPDNPGYRELRPALFEEDGTRRRAALEDFRQRHGQRALEIAISGGQYHDPQGPFYGGRRACQGRRVIETLIDRYRLAERQLAVIDLHTGLGAYGYGEIICDHAPASPGTLTAQAWYGSECTLPALGTSSSVPKLGLLDYAWHAIMGHNSCFITLEFGTLDTDNLFDVLLRDHRFRAQYGTRPVEQPGYPELVTALCAHFCPDDDDWRTQVLSRACTVIDRALEGLLV